MVVLVRLQAPQANARTQSGGRNTRRERRVVAADEGLWLVIKLPNSAWQSFAEALQEIEFAVTYDLFRARGCPKTRKAA